MGDDQALGLVADHEIEAEALMGVFDLIVARYGASETRWVVDTVMNDVERKVQTL